MEMGEDVGKGGGWRRQWWLESGTSTSTVTMTELSLTSNYMTAGSEFQNFVYYS